MGVQSAVDIKGEAKFVKDRFWHSYFGWAKFVLKKGRAICVKTYYQEQKDTGEKGFPKFSDKEFERMRDKACNILTNRSSGKKPPPPQPVVQVDKPRPHQVDKCEKCQELGFPCTGIIEDVTGKFFSVSHRDLKQRRKRLKDSPSVVLYHQTSREIANKIIKTQEMKPGTKGLAGGGIYFALTPEDTDGKAHNRGPILKCTVKLGNVKKLGANGDSGMNFEKLFNGDGGPFDSVFIRRDRPERVVYMSDQVIKIEYHSR
eukprot:m.44472 g.44472  ORF g.44472 m.44472 type:complete len:259 (+) comp10099_c0_seq1:169-945(+)